MWDKNYIKYIEDTEQENEELKDKVNELATKIVAYEQMHDRAIKDIQEYSKALEIIIKYFAPDNQSINVDSMVNDFLSMARKEIAND